MCLLSVALHTGGLKDGDFMTPTRISRLFLHHCFPLLDLHVSCVFICLCLDFSEKWVDDRRSLQQLFSRIKTL